jgi:hypothetical protein
MPGLHLTRTAVEHDRMESFGVYRHLLLPSNIFSAKISPPYLSRTIAGQRKLLTDILGSGALKELLSIRVPY